MNSIKHGTVLYGLQPEMAFCHTFVMAVYKSHSIPCIPTSITGKKHGTGSLHPVGYAVDYRTKHILGANRRQVIDLLVKDLKNALPCCDVIFEYEDEPEEHIHIEFDPKDDKQFQEDKAWYKANGYWPGRR